MGDEVVNLNNIVKSFYRHSLILKTLHFKTKSYSVHKTTDKYLEKFADNYDNFMETAQGIFGKINLPDFDLKVPNVNEKNVIDLINYYIDDLHKLKFLETRYPELTNIKDELVGEAQRLKYLLSFI